MSAIKVHYPIRHKVGTSIQEFSHYWITYHAEFAKSFAPIRGMAQCLGLPDKPAVLDAPLGETWCDGAAEMWLDDDEALAQLTADPRFAAVIADEDNFIEPGRRFFVKTVENVLDEAGFDRWRRGVKVTVFARRPPHTSRRDFLAAWDADDATALGRALAASRHVACPSVDPESADAAAGDAAPYDAVRELWWPDRDAVQAAAESDPDAWAALVHPSAIDAPRSFALYSHERILLPA
jgi:hypothetical protein